ncbi:MAG: T9SS type A sorting domain-containing protein [Bacteroidota bacterium]
MKIKFQFYLFFLYCFLQSNICFGQLFFSESFEDASNCPQHTGNCGATIDDNTCLSDWSVSNGTPRIRFNSSIAHDGDNELNLLYSHGSFALGTPLRTDGIFYSGMNFEKGKCYILTFWFRTVNSGVQDFRPVDLGVYLANGLTHSPSTTGPCWEVPPAVATQEVYKKNFPLNYNETTAYQQVSVNVTADADYDFLWFVLEGINELYTASPVQIYSTDIDLVEVYGCGFPCVCKTIGTQIGGLDSSGEELTVDVSDLYPGGLMPSGCYEVQGTLNIDQNTTVQNATFVMSPGARIVVENGVTFNVSSSSFRGCLNLWDGIEVASGGTLRFINNKISDALHAIDVTNNSFLELRETIFANNHIGLYAHEGQINIIGTIAHNTFQGLDGTPLLPTTVDQEAFLFPAGSIAYAGILLYKTGPFKVGKKNDSSLTNDFLDLKNGVVAAGSFPEIFYCNFVNMIGSNHSYDFPYEGLEGKGVFMDLCLESDGKFNTFDDMQIGSLAHHSSGGAAVNEMVNTSVGIEIRDALGQEYIAIQNEITPTQTGIHVVNSTGAFGIDLLSNQIDFLLPNTSNTGAIFINNTTGIQGAFNVDLNVINSTGIMTAGLRMTNSAFWQVADNSIVNQNPFFGAVIDIDASSNCAFRNNTLVGTANQNGFVIENSPDMLYCCNFIDDTNIGVQFDGACGGTELRGTSFNTHNIGLRYTQSAVTGPQGSFFATNGNRWNENCPIDEAVHAGNPAASLYFVTPSDGANDVSPTFGWFNTVPIFSTIYCLTFPDCGQPEWLLSPVLPIDSLVALDRLELISKAVQWMEEKRLYKKLMERPELIADNELMASFWEKMQGSEIAQLLTVQNDLVEAMKAEAQPFKALQGGQAQKFSAEDYQALSQRILEGRTEKLSRIKTINTGILTSTVMGTNTRLINDLELQVFLGQALDQKQLEQVYRVAIQCPTEGGNAVFRARGLHDDQTHQWTDWKKKEICTTKTTKRLAVELPQKADFRVYPNPVKDQLNVQLDTDFVGTRSIRVVDINGRLVLEQTMEQSNEWIDVQHLPNGLYTLSVWSSTKGWQSQKVVINR